MNLPQAVEVAVKYRNLLSPWCERIEIAGSIRRRKPEVKDIEIVCVPKSVHLIPFVTTVKQWYKIKGEPTGRYTQRGLYESINLDLFMPQKKDFIRQFAIRTGPAEYSAKVIAVAWVKGGWRGTEDGLRLQKECVLKGKKWICTAARPTLPPEWITEQEFFDWLGVKFIQPEKRC
jgi:DNA polymerase/3'-5' exonuclease PolX